VGGNSGEDVRKGGHVSNLVEAPKTEALGLQRNQNS